MKLTLFTSSGFKYALVGAIMLWGWLVGGGTLQAQDQPITQDEVNAVAEKMYCPVCENIPLDDCATPTCVQWKEEIRVLLTEGKTSTQIVDEFVQRYGEQVVGIPQNPLLRALAFVIPIVGMALAVFIAMRTFRYWRSIPRKLKSSDEDMQAALDTQSDDYRARLEHDLL